ncbi:MAG: hypothetical protein KatS3mg110_4142 [Pirellulaceae bacterium]|nr:MAG: hypothetical protein KatS3mg110_4142 [Pirellulaceae bacterium]
MTLLTDIRVVEAELSTTRVTYRAPLKFGGRVLRDAVIADVTVTVESAAGRRAAGHGSMPVGNVWAWPSNRVPTDQTLTAMLRFAELAVDQVTRITGAGHPLELSEQLSSCFARWADEVGRQLALPEPIPRLAQLVAASPVDAAIHDAYGKVHGTNSYLLLGSDYIRRDLSTFLDERFRGEYLDRYTLADPKPRMPLYHLVGALDPLDDSDVGEPIGDGLPETLAQWIAFNGLTHLKIKLAGDDLAWDVDRVVRVEQVAAEAQARRGCSQWVYSLDFNERCESVDYVLEFLDQVRQRSPRAWERIQYIEQPTHRDLAGHREQKMHRASQLKPVVIDESLVDYESLLLARDMGYSGVALKACKGHAESLLLGAAAQKFQMFLCVQDLTCVGASFLHSASLSARIPTVAAVEGNGRQYCPAGNHGWESRYPGMFQIRDGQVQTGLLCGAGLY